MFTFLSQFQSLQIDAPSVAATAGLLFFELYRTKAWNLRFESHLKGYRSNKVFLYRTMKQL